MVHIKRINEMMTTDGDWDLDEIRIDFFDEEEKRWSVDVYSTSDENEEGECVAYIYEDGRVEFINPDAKTNAVIREEIAQFIRGQRKRPKWESRRASARGRAINEMARTRKTQYFWNIEEMRKVFGDWENYKTVEDSANMDGATDFYSPEDAYADGLENLRDYTDGDYSLSVYYFHNNGAGEYVSDYYAEIHNGKLTER